MTSRIPTLPTMATLSTVLLVTFTLATAARAATWIIEPDGSGDAPTIQAGIDIANPGDVVELADGTFMGPGNRDIEYRGKAITVRSVSGDPETCVINCQNSGRGFYIHSGEGTDSVLENVRIINGNRADCGGIQVNQASPTITGCVIVANSSYGTYGSGVSFYRSAAILEDCVIAWNSGSMHMIQVLCSYQANVDVRGCLIGGSEYGPGVQIGSASPSFSGCTIVQNAREGIRAYGSSTDVILEHTIIARNGDEAVYCSSEATVTASCCDLFENLGGNWVSGVVGQGNLRGNFSADPLFCDLASGDFTIQSDSPCAPPGVTGCGLVGALPIGCGPTALKQVTWGLIKANYR